MGTNSSSSKIACMHIEDKLIVLFKCMYTKDTGQRESCRCHRERSMRQILMCRRYEDKLLILLNRMHAHDAGHGGRGRWQRLASDSSGQEALTCGQTKVCIPEGQAARGANENHFDLRCGSTLLTGYCLVSLA